MLPACRQQHSWLWEQHFALLASPGGSSHHICLQLRSSQHKSCHKASALSHHSTQLLSGNHHAAERNPFRKATFKPHWSSSLKTPLVFSLQRHPNAPFSHSQRRFLLFPPPLHCPQGEERLPLSRCIPAPRVRKHSTATPCVGFTLPAQTH